MIGGVPLQGGGGIVALVIPLVIMVAVFAGLAKMLMKAGEPWWGALPIINIYFIVKLSGKPIWWIILLFVPLVNFVAWILINIDVSKNFGQGIGFGLGLSFLSVIFYPLMGFGDYRYQRGGAGGARR